MHEIAPVFVKNEGRIEAMFTVYFLALLVQALIERELRHAMKQAKIEDLPLYPEQRSCERPTTEQISSGPVFREVAKAQRVRRRSRPLVVADGSAHSERLAEAAREAASARSADSATDLTRRHLKEVPERRRRRPLGSLA